MPKPLISARETLIMLFFYCFDFTQNRGCVCPKNSPKKCWKNSMDSGEKCAKSPTLVGIQTQALR